MPYLVLDASTGDVYKQSADHPDFDKVGEAMELAYHLNGQFKPEFQKYVVAEYKVVYASAQVCDNVKDGSVVNKVGV